MPKYALLLRAVNLGGHGRVSMADLRGLLQLLGHADVVTYLQSGNAVVTAPTDDPDLLGRQVEEGLAQQLGVRTRVLVRTAPELAAVVAANPFPEATDKPAYLHVAFLATQPGTVQVAALDPAAYSPDLFHLGDRAVYLHYLTSPGRSKLGPAVLKRLGVVGTARNWNTVVALARMTAS